MYLKDDTAVAKLLNVKNTDASFLLTYVTGTRRVVSIRIIPLVPNRRKCISVKPVFNIKLINLTILYQTDEDNLIVYKVTIYPYNSRITSLRFTIC